MRTPSNSPIEAIIVACPYPLPAIHGQNNRVVREPYARLADGRVMPMGWSIGKDSPIGMKGTAEYIPTPHASLWKFTPEPLCCEPMRGGQCEMDAGHRGRHSMQVFVCEGCGKRRRGQPHRIQEVWIAGELDDRFEFCFLCVMQSEENRN